MTYFDWDESKNKILIKERGISFEEIKVAAESGGILDTYLHPNRKRYSHQKIMVVEINNYAYLVPYVRDEEKVFLKTIIMKVYQLEPEEEEILKAFDEGKLVRIKDFDKEKKLLEEVARNTLNKTRNINLRLSERDLQKLKAKAARQGIPYQTLAASILHQFTHEQS